MWHGRSREKSRHRSCEVCLTLLNLSLGLKSSSNAKRALSRAINHSPFPSSNMGSVKYRFHCIPSLGRGRGVLVGVRKPKEVSGKDVAQGQTPRHQDVG